MGTILGMFGSVLQAPLKLLTNLLENGLKMLISYHKQSISFAREAGMTAKEAESYTKVLTTRAKELGEKYGIAAEQVQKLEQNLAAATGRMIKLSREESERMVQINKLVGESTTNKFAEEIMHNMGGQISTVQGAVSKAYATAAKSGLHAASFAEKIANNLSMANRLAFKDGVNGMIRMAAMSEKLGVNMQSIESAASKFLKIDEAISGAAHMQMLGGSAAVQFGNPLTAAYEANYDPEAFAKRMSDSLASYAQFDAKTGMSTINGMNMDFVRAIAEQMGISTDEASKMAKKRAEVKYKEANFDDSIRALAGNNQEMRDMLLNRSTIQNGKLGMVDNNQQWHEMSYYQSPEGKKMLEAMTSLEGMSESELVKQQALSLTSIDENITGIMTSLGGAFGEKLNDALPAIRNFVGEIGKTLLDNVGPITENVKRLIVSGNKYLPAILTGTKTIVTWLMKATEFITSSWPVLLGAMFFNPILRLLGGVKNLFFGGAKKAATKTAAKAAGKKAAKKAGKKAAKKAAGNVGLKGLKYMKNQFTGSRAAGKGIFKSIGSMFKSTKNAAGQLMGRTGKGAAWGYVEKAGVQGMKLLRGANIAGWVGLGGDLATDYAVKKGAIKEGSNAHAALKAGSKALEYGALGATIGTFVGGPLGTAIGGGVGALAGAVKGWYDSQAKKYKSFGEFADDKFKTIKQGTSKVLSSIGGAAKSALKTVSKWLGFGGDEDGAKPKKYATGGMVTGGKPGVDSVRAFLTPGERVLTPQEANLWNSGVKAKPVGGKEYIYTPKNTTVSNVGGNKITINDFNVKLSGTIKLDAGNSMKNIDVRQLLNDHSFVSSLKETIKEAINNDMNNGRFMNDLATRRGQTSSSSVVGKL